MMDAAHEKLGTHASIPEETIRGTAPCPPAFFEYAWYVILAYAMLGQAWGIVIPSVGGALLGLLAAACFLNVGAQASRIYAPVGLALCTGVWVIAAQYFFFSPRAFDDSMPFVGWLFTLIIVQALSLRPGFLHRFGLVAFVIGLGVLPYLQLQDDGSGLTRVRASYTGISNPNSLGMWFGFCAVFFLFWGMQARTFTLRAVYWAGGLGSLFMVALTVSRGPLLGIALACVVGLRSALKRHFVPVFVLVLLMWLAYVSGVFQETIDAYITRGTEETGRGRLWPVALQRLVDSPWVGVGLEAVLDEASLQLGRHALWVDNSGYGEVGIARDGTLSYIPLPGEKIEDAEVWAPTAAQWLAFNGDPTTEKFVEKLHFRGLAFRFQNYALPPEGAHFGQAESGLGAAIEANGTHDVSFEKCEFGHTLVHQPCTVRVPSCRDRRDVVADAGDAPAPSAGLSGDQPPGHQQEAADEHLAGGEHQRLHGRRQI